MATTEESLALLIQYNTQLNVTFNQVKEGLKDADEGVQKLNESNTGLLESMTKGWGEISAVVGAASDAFKEAFALMEDYVKTAGPEQAEKLQRWVEMFNQIFDTIRKGAGAAIFWIMDNVIDPLIQSIEQIAIVFADTFSRIGALWDWVTSGFTGGISGIKQQMSNLDTALQQSLEESNKKHARNLATGASIPTAKTPAPGGSGQAKSCGSNASQATPPKPAASAPGEKEVEKYSDEWKKLQEDVNSYQRSLVDLEEQEGQISHGEAAERRVELQKELLDVQTQYLANSSKMKDNSAYVAQEKEINKTKQGLDELKKKSQELNGTFGEGFKAGLSKYVDSLGSTFQKAAKLAQDAAQAMQQAFSDFFFDVMTGKLKSFSQYVENFLQAVARSIANMMASDAASSIAGFFKGLWNPGPSSSTSAALSNPTTGANDMANAATGHTGGLVMHHGGYIGYSPRFHVGGLSSDEVPAVLQRGEYVVSRKGVAALDKINSGQVGGGNVNVVVNVENQTGQPVEAKTKGAQFDGEKYIVGVILKNIEGYGALRHAIAGVK